MLLSSLLRSHILVLRVDAFDVLGAKMTPTGRMGHIKPIAHGPHLAVLVPAWRCSSH